MPFNQQNINSHQLCHDSICPFSRKVRILLSEKNIEFTLVNLESWEKKEKFLIKNPAGRVPIFFDKDNYLFVCEINNIVEYIEEKWCKNNLIGDNLVKRAESRRLQSWFDNKFYGDVTKHILQQRYYGVINPNSFKPSPNIISNSTHNLSMHLKYISSLLENNTYLAGGGISIADISAASHISALDYFGDIKWQNFEIVQNWYTLVKSRKSFGAILKDKILGIPPSPHYNKIDF